MEGGGHYHVIKRGPEQFYPLQVHNLIEGPCMHWPGSNYGGVIGSVEMTILRGADVYNPADCNFIINNYLLYKKYVQGFAKILDTLNF